VRNLLGTHARYLHLVTLADRGIRVVEDLKGKRVSTGPAGSATDVKALRVLGAHGVTPYNLGTHEHLDDSEAARALEDGRLDAFASDASLPMPTVRKLAAASNIGVRLIPTGSTISRITQRHGPSYFVGSIPEGTYPGMDKDVPAAAEMTLFVAHEIMAEPLAYEITKVLLERTPEVALATAMAKRSARRVPFVDLLCRSTRRAALLQGSRHHRAAVLAAPPSGTATRELVFGRRRCSAHWPSRNAGHFALTSSFYDSRRTDPPCASISFTAFLSKEMKVSARPTSSWAITPSAKSPPASSRANPASAAGRFVLTFTPFIKRRIASEISAEGIL
jgi:hypothetical protein